MNSALAPYDLAGIPLANRIVMAPMTRSRAYGPGATPTGLNATYYAQRATAGLIVTEGTQPSVVGQGYPDTPGLHTAEQVAAWRAVTDGVHAEGGRIFAQLMHVGRIGDPDLLPDGMIPVGPSAVAAAGEIYTHSGKKPHVTPHVLTEEEIADTIADFADAAANAIEAGFDGVEIHGANGYLVQQFLATNANVRQDGWGGSIAGRTRFAVEVARAVSSRIGAERTGIRLSPGGVLGDIQEDDREVTYLSLIEQLAPLGLAYVHVMEAPGQRDLVLRMREAWPNTFILNPFTGSEPTGPDALSLVEEGTADLISYGALYIANPDLPDRLHKGGPFNAPDMSKAFGGDHQGYTDYATLA
ncbi:MULTISPECIES: alkene reductase [unclassified Microbacterium]|uniref:alkene reductase n=1 Tax=unclassified Microbacterium TaxID=2609290 RepID=UPI000CFB21D7|nr:MULTISPECIES: alkene reductase [unclassified Microbacterium]PQZ60274.1 alkene reductase [Microbacterium sp. MYb43]PQZ76925.1 alkene reductase [Microbacterium sp. MYb40]PRB23318.1 alkene reductase [Microbacterium sp. MYb54]PRB28221.1 alkene reductase [Microbacterium sp. MYb50]PRB66272.1 alkene reductase [Microbacterium sp. MYb24]